MHGCDDTLEARMDRNLRESFRIKPKHYQIEPKSQKSFKIHRICRIQGYRLEDPVAISSRLGVHGFDDNLEARMDRNLYESFRINPKHCQIEPKSPKSFKIRRICRIQGYGLEDSVSISTRLECTVLMTIWKP